MISTEAETETDSTEWQSTNANKLLNNSIGCGFDSIPNVAVRIFEQEKQQSLRRTCTDDGNEIDSNDWQ
jgi:hypothetical protein